jgi:hypothetical protein
MNHYLIHAMAEAHRSELLDAAAQHRASEHARPAPHARVRARFTTLITRRRNRAIIGAPAGQAAVPAQR